MVSYIEMSALGFCLCKSLLGNFIILVITQMCLL